MSAGDSKPSRVDLALTGLRQVAASVVAGKYLVSTVLIYAGRGPYETMVFRSNADGQPEDWLELDCERTTSLDVALAQHDAVCAKWARSA